MKIKTILFFLITLSFNSVGQSCSPDSLILREKKAIQTDIDIDWELINHQIFINPDCIPNNKLLLHLVGTGDQPTSTTYFPTLAANNGFKVIVLKYKNGISATEVCRNSEVVDCHLNYRQEIIYGTDESPHVEVDSSNSILNRFQKLLVFLESEYPTENWGDFLDDQNDIAWNNIQVSGHSQGGGHAAFIGKEFLVDRVLMFASPNEYNAYFSAPANWIGFPSETPDSNYYGFCNTLDEVVDFSEQYLMWETMNMLIDVDSVKVDNSTCPYDNARGLYTTYDAMTFFSGNHNSVVIDNFTPLDNIDVPIYRSTWEYMLGVCEDPNSIWSLEFEETKLDIFPNPTDDFLTLKSEKIIDRIELIGPLGNTLKHLEPNQADFVINLESYKGILFLKIFSKNKTIRTAKIIVK